MMAGMPPEFDKTAIVGLLLVFGLPLTLLIPGFSIWDVVPKIRVYRFHALSQHVTWSQLNGAIVSVLVVLFCLFLELRKRKLDDTVESVLNLGAETDRVMEMEKKKQIAAIRACALLLDASAEHYENLMLLRDEMRHRRVVGQQPPVIEPSDSSFMQ